MFHFWNGKAKFASAATFLGVEIRAANLWSYHIWLRVTAAQKASYYSVSFANDNMQIWREATAINHAFKILLPRAHTISAEKGICVARRMSDSRNSKAPRRQISIEQKQEVRTQ